MSEETRDESHPAVDTYPSAARGRPHGPQVAAPVLEDEPCGGYDNWLGKRQPLDGCWGSGSSTGMRAAMFDQAYGAAYGGLQLGWHMWPIGTCVLERFRWIVVRVHGVLHGYYICDCLLRFRRGTCDRRVQKVISNEQCTSSLLIHCVRGRTASIDRSI